MVAKPTTCLNCGCEPSPGAPLGLCSRCLSARLLDIVGEDDPDGEELAAAFAKYDLAGEVARGGMGSILRAKDRTLGRTVAMKVMLLKGTASEESRRRFIREALVLARLDHPNIVPIHEMGRDEQGRPFYTMKLVEGETLQAILHRLAGGDPGTLREYTLDRLLTVFRKVCEGMAFAHDRGVIHRDLKPDNIMVGRFGEVLVMDWGLAKFVEAKGTSATSPEFTDHSTRIIRKDEPKPLRGWSDPEFRRVSTAVTMAGEIVGTPAFMSPEQARGIELDRRSDIFSLGAILYAILTLRPPVAGNNLEEILLNVAQADITPPTRLAPIVARPNQGDEPAHAQGSFGTPALRFPHCPGGRVPPALSAVAMQALVRKPEERYQSVEALARDVEAYQGGFATSAEHAGALGQLWLWMKRHRAVSISAGLILCLSIGFVLKLVASERRATQSAILAADNEVKALAAAAQARKAETVARNEQAETRKALAKSRIALAGTAISQGNAGQAMEQLASVPEDLRDADWRYVNQSTDSSHLRFPAGMADAPRVAVAFRPGRPGVFALADRAGHVLLARGETGEAIGEFRSELRGNICLAFTADGNQLAMGSDLSSEVLLLNADSGAVARRLAVGNPGANKLEFSADGKLLIVAANQIRAEVWQPESGRMLWRTSTADLMTAVFHPDGTKVVTCSRKITVHDLVTGDSSRELMAAGDDLIGCALFDPSGRWLMTGDRSGYLRVWDFASGEKVLDRHPYLRNLSSAAFSADGRHLVTLGNAGSGDQSEKRRNLIVWHLESGTPLRTLLGAPANASEIAMDPATSLLAVNGGLGRVWRLGLRPEFSHWSSAAHGPPGNAAFLTADEDLLAPWQDATMAKLRISAEGMPWEIWRPRARGTLRTALSRDRSRFAIYAPVAPAAVRLFSAQNTLQPDLVLPPGDGILWVALDATGDRILVAGRTGPSLTIHDAAPALPPVSLDPGALRNVDQAEFVGGGHHVLGSGILNADRSRAESQEALLLWDTGTGRIVRTLTNSYAINRFAVSEDGARVAAACSDNLLRIFAADSLALLHELRTHNAPLTVVAWHPAGRFVATASEDLALRMWDLQTQTMTGEIIGPAHAAFSLSFSPSGKKLAAVFGDRSTHVWNLDDAPALLPATQ